MAIKLGSNNQEASPSAGKNTGVVLVPFSRMEVRPYNFVGSVDFSGDSGLICYDGWVLSEGRKNYLKDWCLINSRPTFPFWTCLSLMNYGHIIKNM